MYVHYKADVYAQLILMEIIKNEFYPCYSIICTDFTEDEKKRNPKIKKKNSFP